MKHVVLPLLFAGAMPFVLTATAKIGRFSARDNHQTRAWQAELSGWRQRAHWAHQNSFEAFPLFAVGVILSHLSAPGSALGSLAAWGFIAARVAYAVCFLADLAALRSLVWFAATGCVVALYLNALSTTSP